MLIALAKQGSPICKMTQPIEQKITLFSTYVFQRYIISMESINK